MTVSQGATSSTLDKSGERVRDMFAQIAPRYDLMNHVLSVGIDISWRRQVVKRLRLDQELPVLDCCTGTGDLALMLAKRLDQRQRVIGSDFCAPMLDLARNKAAKASMDKEWVEFVEADSQNLPFEDQSFQAVTVAFGLRNVQDTDQGLREMLRVCAKGGQICVLEFSKPTLPGLKQGYQFYFKHILPKVGQAVARNNREAYEYLPESVSEFPCGEALAGRMEAVGISNVKITPLTLGIASIYIGEAAHDS